MSRHRLDFGGLDLTGGTEYGGARFEALGDGSSLGNPEPVERSIASALLDGSFVVTDSHNNREVSFQVHIVAPDSAALAYGEKILFEQCSRRVELGWTPPDGWGPRTVFEAFTSSLTHQFDDLLEVTQLTRAYSLRLVCYPFGFSEDEVVDVAVVGAPASPSTVTISDGTSATGWTSPDGTITSSSGALVVPSHVSSIGRTSGGMDSRSHEASARLGLTPASFAATPFITADLSAASTRDLRARLVVANGSYVPFSEVAQPDGSVRFSWKLSTLDAASVSALTFVTNVVSEVPAGSAAPTVTVRLDNVTRTNVGPAASPSGRESQRYIEVTGSARTPASIAIEHATAALGDVLVYTSPELATGYTPALRNFITSNPNGTTGPGATGVSGFISTGDNNIVFDVPASSLPAGPHLLMAPLSGYSVSTIKVSTLIGSTVVNEQILTPPTTSTGLVPLAVVNLPTVSYPAGSSAKVRITLKGNTPLFQFDELWSFYMGEGAELTQVSCGTGTPASGGAANRLFLDAPNINNGGLPAIYMGTAANRSDAYRPTTITSWGSHKFCPPQTRLFVVTTGAASPTISLRHRPAWFTHAGR